ncbi:MAG: VOC family protein [Cyanobacteriota bacterium]|jgi:extradiol dioxygenase family protein
MNTPPLFHLAIPVGDIPQAKAFYCECLGCRSGRETPQALILDFYGHQLVAHTTLEPIPVQKGVYPRHFGVVFSELKDWQDLVEKLQAQGTEFVVEPKQRFPGQPTEHHTFFISDPFANLLEFKVYRYPEAIFGVRDFGSIGDR